jgi:hypothetical protein
MKLSPQKFSPVMWLGLVFAIATSAVILTFRIRRLSRRCAIGREPLSGGQFTCPRCLLVVCGLSSCWNAEYFRCALCHSSRIPLLPENSDWWDAEFDSRVRSGRCMKCEEEASKCDLRHCKHCHFVFCRACWDYENGKCTNCNWVVPDVPPALRPFFPRSRRVVREHETASRS